MLVVLFNTSWTRFSEISLTVLFMWTIYLSPARISSLISNMFSRFLTDSTSTPKYKPGQVCVSSSFSRVSWDESFSRRLCSLVQTHCCDLYLSSTLRQERFTAFSGNHQLLQTFHQRSSRTSFPPNQGLEGKKFIFNLDSIHAGLILLCQICHPCQHSHPGSPRSNRQNLRFCRCFLFSRWSGSPAGSSRLLGSSVHLLQETFLAESRYSAFDRELFAAYSALRHFRFLPEGNEFVLFSDHKPLTHALFRTTLPWSAMQQGRLSCIPSSTARLFTFQAQKM